MHNYLNRIFYYILTKTVSYLIMYSLSMPTHHSIYKYILILNFRTIIYIYSIHMPTWYGTQLKSYTYWMVWCRQPTQLTPPIMCVSNTQLTHTTTRDHECLCQSDLTYQLRLMMGNDRCASSVFAKQMNPNPINEKRGVQDDEHISKLHIWLDVHTCVCRWGCDAWCETRRWCYKHLLCHTLNDMEALFIK